MPDSVVITGGGSGIGKALAIKFAENDFDVWIVGRTQSKLDEVCACFPRKIKCVIGDISDEATRSTIADKLWGQKLRYLIHNAAVLRPVGNMLKMTPEDFRYHLAVNVEAPLFLTSTLLDTFESNGRILHVSSTAAHMLMPGWGAYCVSKSALHTLYGMLKHDLSGRGIQIGSAYPGIVDTPMQAEIRELTEDEFPQVELFRSLKAKGKLLSPELIAENFFWLLTQADEAIFSEKDWEIKALMSISGKS